MTSTGRIGKPWSIVGGLHKSLRPLARKIHTNDLVYSCAMALLLLGYMVTTITIRQKEGHGYDRL